MKTAWLVDDDASIRFVLEKALTRAGFQVESFVDAQNVLNALKFSQPSVLISDVRMPGMDGMDGRDGDSVKGDHGPKGEPGAPGPPGPAGQSLSGSDPVPIPGIFRNYNDLY